MKITRFNRLKKLMTMTESDNDQEALTAIRAANKLLSEDQVNWDRVFKRLVTVEIEEMEADGRIEEPQAPTPAAAKAEKAEKTAFQKRVDEWFAIVESKDPRGTFADFIDDLKEQWDRKHWLSPRQLDALQRAADGR